MSTRCSRSRVFAVPEGARLGRGTRRRTRSLPARREQPTAASRPRPTVGPRHAPRDIGRCSAMGRGVGDERVGGAPRNYAERGGGAGPGHGPLVAPTRLAPGSDRSQLEIHRHRSLLGALPLPGDVPSDHRGQGAQRRFALGARLGQRLRGRHRPPRRRGGDQWAADLAVPPREPGPSAGAQLRQRPRDRQRAARRVALSEPAIRLSLDDSRARRAARCRNEARAIAPALSSPLPQRTRSASPARQTRLAWEGEVTQVLAPLLPAGVSSSERGLRTPLGVTRPAAQVKLGAGD